MRCWPRWWTQRERLDADALLLAGDVFDNERVTDEVLERFVEQMARLTPGDRAAGQSRLGAQDFRVPPPTLRGSASQPASIQRSGRGDTGHPGAGPRAVGQGHAVAHAGLPPLGRDARADAGAMAGGDGPRSLPLRERPGPALLAHLPGRRGGGGLPLLGAGPLGPPRRRLRADTTAVYSGCPYGPIGAPDKGAVCVVELDRRPASATGWSCCRGRDKRRRSLKLSVFLESPGGAMKVCFELSRVRPASVQQCFNFPMYPFQTGESQTSSVSRASQTSWTFHFPPLSVHSRGVAVRATAERMANTWPGFPQNRLQHC